MSLTTPPSVQKLQMALHAKAKESPSFRFYALYYDKMYREDLLAFAYAYCKTNGGAAGWTARHSRTLRSMEWSDGWTN